MNPSAMPKGYYHHQDVYKAAPGPNSDELGYDYSLEKNEEILLAWREVVGDLVTQFEAHAKLAPQPLYLEPLPSDNAFNNTYDDVLREELTARGYTLAPAPGVTPILRYEAFVPKGTDTLKNTGHSYTRDFVLILTLLDASVYTLPKDEQDTAVLGQASGAYKLPGYGHETAIPVLSLFEPVVGGPQ